MKFARSLVVPAVLLGTALAARAADPSISLSLGAGAPSGAISVLANPRGGSIQSASLVFRFDSGQVVTPTSASVALASGWQLTRFTRLSANSVRLDLSNSSGQSAYGLMFSLSLTHKQAGFHSAVLTLDGASTLDGGDSDGFPGPFFTGEQQAAFVYGKARNIGGSAPASLSVGVNNGAPIVASVIGTRLYLMDPSTSNMANLPGWTGGKSVSDPVSHRPAFGEISGGLAVAVGTDLGGSAVFNVADGSLLSSGSLGLAVTGTPAITGTAGDIYWPVLTNDGPAVVHRRVGGGADSVRLGNASDSLVSSPAVWNNLLVLGTDTTASTFHTDPSTGVITPQAAGTLDGDSFGTAPVVVNGMGYIGGQSGAVYRVNMTTGAAAGTATLPAEATPLSHPFHDAARNAVVFGGADGKLYRVSTADLSVTSETVGTAPLNSPVVIGDQTIVSDVLGQVTRLQGATTETLSLPAPLAPAPGVARGAPDQLLLNTTDGSVVAIPLS